MNKPELENFFWLGNPDTYEGDDPWFDLRFRTPIDKKNRKVLREIIEPKGSPLEGCFEWRWEGDRHLTLDGSWMMPALDENFPDGWDGFCRTIRKTMDKVHQVLPLVAVVFCDEVFFNIKATKLTDEKLLAIQRNK